jgi:hypothetical protein
MTACLTALLVVGLLETQYMPYVRRLGMRPQKRPSDET